MADGLVDFSRSDYQEALRLIPPRFLGLARQYAEEVAAKINTQYAHDPSVLGNVRDTTVFCALNGLSCIRWYLLFKPERADAAEQAWKAGGVVGLCLYMRELHQAERTLLVSGYGNVKPEEAEARLSALHEKGAFTLVATTHGFAADRVKTWANQAGVHHLHFPLDSDRDLSSKLSGQYYVLLDKLMPEAVCVFTNDSLAMRLVEYAARKQVPVISAPDPVRSAPARSTPSVSTKPQPESAAPPEKLTPRPFQFTALMKGYSPEP